MSKPRILIVQDNPDFLKAWRGMLDDVVEIVPAMTLEAAYAALDASLDFAIIVVNACMSTREPNTEGLIREIRRRGFTNPIIAESADPQFAARIRGAGATTHGHPWEVPPLVIQFLRSDVRTWGGKSG